MQVGSLSGPLRRPPHSLFAIPARIRCGQNSCAGTAARWCCTASAGTRQKPNGPKNSLPQCSWRLRGDCLYLANANRYAGTVLAADAPAHGDEWLTGGGDQIAVIWLTPKQKQCICGSSRRRDDDGTASVQSLPQADWRNAVHHHSCATVEIGLFLTTYPGAWPMKSICLAPRDGSAPLAPCQRGVEGVGRDEPGQGLGTFVLSFFSVSSQRLARKTFIFLQTSQLSALVVIVGGGKLRFWHFFFVSNQASTTSYTR
jgi:hypothetical protein